MYTVHCKSLCCIRRKGGWGTKSNPVVARAPSSSSRGWKREKERERVCVTNTKTGSPFYRSVWTWMPTVADDMCPSPRGREKKAVRLLFYLTSHPYRLDIGLHVDTNTPESSLSMSVDDQDFLLFSQATFFSFIFISFVRRLVVRKSSSKTEPSWNEIENKKKGKGKKRNKKEKKQPGGLACRPMESAQ